MTNIGFIGTGNMGGALAVAASKNSNNEIFLCNRHTAKAIAVSDLTGGRTVTNAEEIAKVSKYIFLGVKPQNISDLLSSLSLPLSSRKDRFIIVSMAAGTPIQKIHTLLGFECPVIRIMPNIPVKAGEGMILYSCSPDVNHGEETEFLSAMKYAGRFIKLEENLIDAGSAVSGCGPAFAAMFVEALADGGVACGLPRKQAVELASQMVLGTAKMILDEDIHPGTLKDAVCSPGGTTIQGVLALEDGAFRSAVAGAVISAYEKTISLK